MGAEIKIAPRFGASIINIKLTLEFCFPQTVKVAIFVNCERFIVASADDGLGLILKIYSDATPLGLDIDESYVVFGEHWVSHATHLHLDTAVVDALNNWEMLLAAGINSIGNELLHLLAAAYNSDS